MKDDSRKPEKIFNTGPLGSCYRKTPTGAPRLFHTKNGMFEDKILEGVGGPNRDVRLS